MFKLSLVSVPTSRTNGSQPTFFEGGFQYVMRLNLEVKVDVRVISLRGLETKAD